MPAGADREECGSGGGAGRGREGSLNCSYAYIHMNLSLLLRITEYLSHALVTSLLALLDDSRPDCSVAPHIDWPIKRLLHSWLDKLRHSWIDGWLG